MNPMSEAFFTACQLLWQGDPATYAAIRVTLISASFALLGSMLVGIPLGFVLGYCNFWGKKALRLLVDTCLSFPTVVIGLLVYLLLSRQGPLGEWGLLFSITGISFGLALLGLPIVASMIATAVEGADTRLRPTLFSLGANAWQMVWETLWELRFHMALAIAAAFGRIVSEVGIAMMVGGNIKWHTRTITTAIALETGKGDFTTGIALGMVLLAIALLLNLLLTVLKKRAV